MPLRRRSVALVATAAVAVLAGVLAVTQPWLLLVDERVSEAVPQAARVPATTGPSPGPAAAGPTTDPAPGPTTAGGAGGASTAPAPGPVELARGELVSHEHTTTGTARVLDLGDGTRVLRLEGLDTSNGPDLRVWLSDAPVLEGRDGWFVFDDGAYLDLGPLEGNQGDANYEIPAGADLGSLTSISIWCARFRVSFGAATLA